MHYWTDQTSDSHDLDKPFETSEIAWIARVERQIRGERRRGDQQVEAAPSAGFRGGLRKSYVEPRICPGDRNIDRKRDERRFRALQSVLAPRPFGSVHGCVWADREFRKRDRRDRRGLGDKRSIDLGEIDDYRGIEERLLSAVGTRAAWGPDQRGRLCPS